MTPDLVILHEHPEWQKPLFAALERRGVAFAPFDLKQAAFSNVDAPRAPLYFNQASPSAYVRGNTRAVPLALAYMRTLERRGARVLNGADVFALELSKSAQATLLRTLGIDTPRSITFNDVGGAARARRRASRWPALLKPDQGGSGARIQVVESLDEVEAIFAADPGVWLPDNLFLLQEYLPHDPEHGIVRLEFLGGELLYAMRVKTHGRFNLCPSPVCNPGRRRRRRARSRQPAVAAPPVEFYPVSRKCRATRSETAQRIVRAARLDVGGIEYLETPDGRRVFYDINANSNLRPVGRRGVRLRSVRARRRLPSARAARGRRARRAPPRSRRSSLPADGLRIGKRDRVRLLMIDDRVGVDRAALMILQLERGDPFEERRNPRASSENATRWKPEVSRAPCGWPVNSASFVVPPSLEIISGPLGFSTSGGTPRRRRGRARAGTTTPLPADWERRARHDQTRRLIATLGLPQLHRVALGISCRRANRPFGYDSGSLRSILSRAQLRHHGVDDRRHGN